MLKPESLELNEKGKMVVDEVRRGRDCGPANFKDFCLYSGVRWEPLDTFEQVNMDLLVLERNNCGY